jgi:release factor glutamine methyltransferase
MITNRVSRARTVSVCLKEAVDFLESRGVPEADISAEAIISFILKRPQLMIYSEPDLEMPFPQEETLKSLLKKRAERYPLQYLLGAVPFRSAMLSVGEGCLIPRPETEVLVDVVLNELGHGNESLNLLDVGTGSGNISISLAQELPFCKITAADISEEALQYARKNADQNGVSNRIHFVRTDLWAGVDSKFDVLISNPPYLSANDLRELQPEAAFEPRGALDGGPSGLECIRRIIRGAPEILNPGGFIALEVGMGQAESVSEELKSNGFDSIRIQKDLCGIDRIILGRFRKNG